MAKKIFKAIMAISIIVVIVCTACISFVLYDYFGKIIEKQLKTEASLISQEMENHDDYFKNLKLVDNRITLISNDGTVIYDSQANEADMTNHSGREEFIEAKEKGEAYAVRYSETLDTKTIYYAVQLDDGRILRISQSQNMVVMLLRGLVAPITVMIILVVGLALVISRVASRRIVMPINKMDLNDMEADEPYPELAPLMRKIRRQNNHIQRQFGELERKQKEFISITENMSEGFILADSNMEILSYNTAAIRLLGDDPPQELHTAFQLNRTKSFRTAVEDALAGRSSTQLLETESKCCNIMANPVVENGKVVGIVIMVVDVTEREQREKLRREFTSNVSHELKTPLTTIYGVSEMIAEGIVKPEDVKDFGMNIKDESARMISLIDDIIKLSKLDEKSVIQELTHVDIFEIAKNVIQRLQTSADERCVIMHLGGHSAIVKGIPSLCDEIVYNLCENAIKYNKKSGSVEVCVKSDDADVILSVKDTGVGIPFEYQNRVFERFFRVDKSHSRQVGGTGLGLSIVKNAVGYLGGSILIESEENKGTKITVRLPLADRE